MKEKAVKLEENKENHIDENIHFQLDLLTPLDKKEDERIKKYLKHINSAIENPEVKNLALTGVYGSGKSTIIKSYKSKYPENKVLNISLSSFNDTYTYEKFKDQIQLTILQQIIYSQSSDKLKNSRINRINEIDIWNKKHYLKTVLLIVFLISLYSVLNYYKFQLNPNNWNFSRNFSLGAFVSLLMLIFSSFFIIQFLLKTMSNSKINKINIKGEAELGNKIEHKDFLNKYLDEILYFFEKIPIDIVVIEDLDRFNSTEIYRTLRELNFILNNYLENIKGKEFKKITFLYAVRDNLFLNELDRTKFFDLIIPTIPYVNYSNSKNVLTQKLSYLYGSEKDLFNRPDGNKDFINTVSSFITDNRILINITNEFIVYKEQQKLQNEEFNQEKLLALIIYKNLRPKDFSKLHSRNSNIDIIFSNKKSLIESSIQDFSSEIDKLKEDIAEIKKQNLESIANLNTIFIYHLKEKIINKSIRGLYIDSTRKSFKTIINENFDLNIYYDEKIKWYDINNYANDTNISLNDIDDLVGYKYSDRYNIVVNENELIKKIENKISQLKSSIKDLNNETIEGILKKKDLSKIKLEEEFKKFYSESEIKTNGYKIYNDSLLIFLLENGYIDEHYRDYISTFQMGGLSENDQQFKINIISRVNNPKPFDYALSNIDDIIKELPINYFNDSRILNYNILDFLLVHGSAFSYNLKAVINTISKWDNRSKSFIIEYLYNGNHKRQFFSVLSNNWNEFWSKIQSDDDILKKDVNQLLILFLNELDNNALVSLNKNNILSKYIANNTEILLNFTSNGELERIEEILSKDVLDVKFIDIDMLSEKYIVQLNVLYKHNRYEINDNNLQTIIINYCEYVFENDEYKNSNLSYIYESNPKKLIKYIEEDSYNTYISSFYSKLENNQFDKEADILKVVNSEEILNENLTVFLEKQDNKISKLFNIDNENNYNLIFDYNMINPSWTNVFDYYDHTEEDNLNHTLIKFLNSKENYLKLSKYKLNSTDKKKEYIEKFCIQMILNSDLHKKSFLYLIKSVPYTYNVLEFETLSLENIQIMIKSKLLNLTQSNYDRLKQNFPNEHIKLIEVHFNKSLDILDTLDFDSDDFLLLLKENNLTSKQYIKIIDKVEDKIIIENEKSCNIVCNILSKSNFLKIDYELFYYLMKYTESLIDRLNLLLIQFHYLNSEELRNVLNLLPEPYSKLTKPRHQPSFEYNQTNIKLLYNMHSRGLIYPFKQSKGKKIKVMVKYD